MPFAFLRDRDYWYSRLPYYSETEHRWQQQEPPQKDLLSHSILLIGDAGHPSLDGKDPILHLIHEQLSIYKQDLTVIFLGDNVYPKGLPDKHSALRKISEDRLTAQLDLFKNFDGRLIFLSGNHDWNRGRANGFEYVTRQEKYIENYTNRIDVFLPSNGCPGPKTIKLHENLYLIVINTQWWVQRGYKPIGISAGCEAQSEMHFYELLEQALESLAEKQVIIAGHHPLFSNALHGGRFTLKHHLFPLTALHGKLYFPLPVAGSLYPLYRRFFGAYEDMSFPPYKRMRRKLLSIVKKYRNIVYAAGHDHNLQYFHQHDNHFIVSGSGSKTSFVHKGGKASFTHAQKGCFRLDYYKNQELWLHVLEPANSYAGHQEVFRKKLN
ncbi:metallophosphoesterase [Xanthocytophaga agilis]|uniref:Metallophosphoesterase n=1 Tax=Xanthocytophaga agilis TaxID=3048010 RepID=A0AAE3QWH7_9BACT|nr:metallophosphoesterase [Xanthocytophaga agilis]MDJ1499349.1 metallophosphoesterase [Xanthocytophaga agilis]